MVENWRYDRMELKNNTIQVWRKINNEQFIIGHTVMRNMFLRGLRNGLMGMGFAI